MPSMGISTPALCATTDAAGHFQLPGMAAEWQPGTTNNQIMGELWASGKLGDGRIGLGKSTGFIKPPPDKPGEQRITLKPTFSVSGRVLNALTKQPVAGATVRVQGTESLLNIIESVKTDREGRYSFPAVPPSHILLAVARCDGYGTNWAH